MFHMRRRQLAVVAFLALLLTGAAFGKDKKEDRDARARAEIQQVLDKYLEARFRGAPWKDYRDLVTWTEEQEADGPPCTTVVRSYNPGDIRLKDDRTALATVVFYQLGTYCPAEHAFKPAPTLDHAIFQLRKRSIVWAVEKTSRPGGQVDWNVVRDRLKQELAESFLVSDVRAQVARSLTLLERTANAIGRTGGSTRQ
jgi:hypothetical protein